MRGRDRRKRERRSIRSPRRRAPAGSVPGTLVVDPSSPVPTLRSLSYRADQVREEEGRFDFNPETRTPAQSEEVQWLSVEGLGDAEVLAKIRDEIGLHPLAMEDVVSAGHRPKAEAYDEDLFVVLPIPSPKSRRTEQVSLYLQGNRVITFQDRASDVLEPVRERIRNDRGRIRASGADYLAYAILDAIIDHYYPVIEAHADKLENLEEAVVKRRSGSPIQELHQIRHGLLCLSRTLKPYQEILSTFLKHDTTVFSAATQVYLRDCQDHVSHLTEAVDGYQEMATSLMDSHIAALSMRTNEVMRSLTVVATVFIPLTFIAGVYGMNFSPDASPLNMPELRWYWGYPFALGLMAASALGLVGFVWHRGWLPPRQPRYRHRRNPQR